MTTPGDGSNVRRAKEHTDRLWGSATGSLSSALQRVVEKEEAFLDVATDAIVMQGQPYREAGRPVTFDSQGTAGLAFDAGCSGAGQAAACCSGHRWDQEARVRPSHWSALARSQPPAAGAGRASSSLNRYERDRHHPAPGGGGQAQAF